MTHPPQVKQGSGQRRGGKWPAPRKRVASAAQAGSHDRAAAPIARASGHSLKREGERAPVREITSKWGKTMIKQRRVEKYQRWQRRH